jgi:hypothetical protein
MWKARLKPSRERLTFRPCLTFRSTGEYLCYSTAPQIFSDSNANGLSDYNEQILAIPAEFKTELPPWEVNVAAFITENAAAVSSSALARVEHLFRAY